MPFLETIVCTLHPTRSTPVRHLNDRLITGANWRSTIKWLFHRISSNLLSRKEEREEEVKRGRGELIAGRLLSCMSLQSPCILVCLLSFVERGEGDAFNKI